MRRHRTLSGAVGSRARLPPPRRDASGRTSARSVTDGASGVGPMVVHGEQLYAATWNYDWTRVHDQDLGPCHVYRYVRPGPLGGLRRSRATRSACSRWRRGAASWWSSATTGRSTPIGAARRGSGSSAFDTFAHPIGRPRRRPGPRDAPAGVGADASSGTAWEDLGNPLGDPARCDEVHSIVTHRGRLLVGTWPLGRVARWDPDGGTWTQTRPPRRQHRGDGPQRLQRQALRGHDPARRGLPLRARRRRGRACGGLFDPPGWRPGPRRRTCGGRPMATDGCASGRGSRA